MSEIEETAKELIEKGRKAQAIFEGYTQEQVDKIHSALVNALDKMKIRFDQGGEVDTGFYLDKELAND